MTTKRVYFWEIITLFIFIENVQAHDTLHRDPFFLPECSIKITKKKKLTIQGIVREGQQYGALLSQGKDSSVVFTGDIWADYTVKNVSGNEVCLVQDNEQVVLKLDPEL